MTSESTATSKYRAHSRSCCLCLNVLLYGQAQWARFHHRPRPVLSSLRLYILSCRSGSQSLLIQINKMNCTVKQTIKIIVDSLQKKRSYDNVRVARYPIQYLHFCSKIGLLLPGLLRKYLVSSTFC